MQWSVERVLALAPDAAGARAGRDLANARRWAGLGRSEAALWGECSGSAAEPYRAAVDLAEPAFRCSCPSRKFPCKHALGLFLLHAASPDDLPAGSPPPWLEEWLAARARRAAGPDPASRAEPAATADPAKLAQEQARRARRRTARVDAGVDELERWLRDLARRGLGDLPSRPRQFWAQPAARMVDAQAPGLARLLHRMAGVPHSGAGWPERVAAHLGGLCLAVEGWRRLDSLPAELRHELRAVVGFTEAKEEVLAGPAVADEWLVLGRSVEQEERLRVQRTWLWASRAERPALVLDFAARQQPLDTSLVPGIALDAELAFYPAALPLRALVARRAGEARPICAFPGAPSFEAALRDFATALAGNPWLERAPMALRGVLPLRDGPGWCLLDAERALVPLAGGVPGWTLLALAGGRPIDVFGEWDGERLAPLSAWAEGRFVPLAAAS